MDSWVIYDILGEDMARIVARKNENTPYMHPKKI